MNVRFHSRRRLPWLAWLLTLFASLAIVDAATPVRFVLVGDSTVTDSAGWGLGFQQLLTDQATCTNTASGGRSSKSFIDEGRWAKALAQKGDYYLIQFGHNDEPGKGPERETDPATTFRTNLVRCVTEARAIGGQPILVTSLVRRSWDKSTPGKIKSSLVPYVEAAKAVAAELHVPVLDLHARSQELCEQLGREGCLPFSPMKTDNGTNTVDNTHLNAKGSVIFARLVIEELLRAVPELKPCFRAEPAAVQAAPGAAAAAEVSRKVFDVRTNGAKGDGVTLDTAAIQKALDACGGAGGGTVRLSAGTYVSAPLTLRTRTTLLLEAGAKLLATTNQSVFMKTPGDWLTAKSSSDFIPFIGGKDLVDVTITGPGTIDGNGEAWWGPAEEARRKVSGFTLPRPNLIVLTSCQNLKVTGVTLQNSPKFHLVPTDCLDVLIEGVTFLAPTGAPNTDAIDPSVSRRVVITKCLIDVGDDNVAIKSGKAMPGREFACEDLTITDCTFRHGHGLSIGSETVGGVRNVTVERCTFVDTENGIRIKSPRGKGGAIENLRCRDISMTNVDSAITITCYYPKVPKEDAAQPVTPETPSFRNIEIRNLTATCPKAAGMIIGLPESLVTNVVLENVHITAETGLTIRNASGVQFKNVKVETKKGPPFILENTKVEGR